MNLRTTTIVAAIGLLVAIIIHFATFSYEHLGEYPRAWIALLFPLMRDLPLSIFLLTLYTKQKS